MHVRIKYCNKVQVGEKIEGRNKLWSWPYCWLWLLLLAHLGANEPVPKALMSGVWWNTLCFSVKIPAIPWYLRTALLGVGGQGWHVCPAWHLKWPQSRRNVGCQWPWSLTICNHVFSPGDLPMADMASLDTLEPALRSVPSADPPPPPWGSTIREVPILRAKQRGQYTGCRGERLPKPKGTSSSPALSCLFTVTLENSVKTKIKMKENNSQL